MSGLPVRLLVACYHTRVVGGTETYLRLLLPALARRVEAVAVLTRSTEEPIAGGMIPPGIAWLSAAGQPPADLVRTAAVWEPTLVYTHGLGEPEYESTLATYFPTAFYAHNYGGTCISGKKSHAFPSAMPCQRTFGPACFMHYLPRRCGGLNPVEAIRSYRRERVRQHTFGRFRAVLAASHSMASELTRNGTPPERVHLVPLPGIVVPDPAPPRVKPLSGRILFVGRITALKGWSQLLAAIPSAAAELGRPLTLVVAGEGPDRAAFEAAARRSGVRAEFLGWVGSERREAETRAADLLAVPSVWPEPFGLVGIEAGCVGTPAVGFAVGGIPDWLKPGVSGESAPGDHPKPRELAAAIVRALRDPDHWQRLRVGAWETAKLFSVEAHLDRLLPVLADAAGL